MPYLKNQEHLCTIVHIPSLIFIPELKLFSFNLWFPCFYPISWTRAVFYLGKTKLEYKDLFYLCNGFLSDKFTKLRKTLPAPYCIGKKKIILLKFIIMVYPLSISVLNLFHFLYIFISIFSVSSFLLIFLSLCIFVLSFSLSSSFIFFSLKW